MEQRFSADHRRALFSMSELFARDSGKMQGKRMVFIGCAPVRSALYSVRS